MQGDPVTAGKLLSGQGMTTGSHRCPGAHIGLRQRAPPRIPEGPVGEYLPGLREPGAATRVERHRRLAQTVERAGGSRSEEAEVRLLVDGTRVPSLLMRPMSSLHQVVPTISLGVGSLAGERR